MSPGTRNSDCTPELVSRAHTEATGRNWNYTEHRKPAITKKYIVSVLILSKQIRTGIRKLCIILMGINKLCVILMGINKQCVILMGINKLCIILMGINKLCIILMGINKLCIILMGINKLVSY